MTHDIYLILTLLLKVGMKKSALGRDALGRVIYEELLEQRNPVVVKRPILIDRNAAPFPLWKSFFVIFV